MKKIQESVGRYLDDKRKAETNEWSKILVDVRDLVDDRNRQIRDIEASAQVKINELQRIIDSLKRENHFLRGAKVNGKAEHNRSNPSQKQDPIPRPGDNIHPIKGDVVIETAAVQRRVGPSSPPPEQPNAGRTNTGPHNRSSTSTSRRPASFHRSNEENSCRPFPSQERYRSTPRHNGHGGASIACRKCGKRFPNSKQYGLHVLHCLKPFQCHICKKTLSSRQSFQNHMHNTHLDGQ